MGVQEDFEMASRRQAGSSLLRAEGFTQYGITPADPDSKNEISRIAYIIIMNKPISIALLVAGVVLTVIGINATNSFSSNVSRFFTGSPTDKAVWMLVGGIIMAIVGLLGLGFGSRKA
jgi:hypothetical protein